MGVSGPCPQWGLGTKPLIGSGAFLEEADDTFGENVLLCLGFKTDKVIFAFIA